MIHVIGSGEHEARQAMIGKTIKNVIYSLNHGVETMTLVFDDSYVVLGPVKDHLGHKLNRPDELAHLDDDAPYVTCTYCERKSWSNLPGDYCRMPQPNGKPCGGCFY